MTRLQSSPFPIIAAGALLLAALAVPLLRAGAEQPVTPEFARTWERTDKPVADLEVNRTWIWGPAGNTAGVMEAYVDAPGGQRLVQYFDKARMEIPTNPDVGVDSPWYVTTGLLPIELMTGRLQLGDNLFEQHIPAEINVAGDPTDPNAPTYANVAGLMNLSAQPVGQVIIATVDGNGHVGSDGRFSNYGVTAAYQVPETGHTVASVFWNFMNSSGTISVNGGLTTGPMFQDPFFGFGFPVTGAYWTTIELDGDPTDILVQVFERRVATYTPSNPEGWRVETGNVGQHYFRWRYELIGEQDPAPTATPDPDATATPGDPGATPTESDPDACIACDLAYGRGEIGTAGREPLGDGEFSPLSQPYLRVPVAPNDVIDGVSIGAGPTATINLPKTFALVSSWSPSDKLYYVVDFNDGSVYVGGLRDAHLGLNVTHEFRGRGQFQVKVWAIDPESDVRTPIAEKVITVE